MKRRKLCVHDKPVQQFECLRQLPTLTQKDCRDVIDLLREDGKGQATGTKEKNKYPLSCHLLPEIWTGKDDKVQVFVNHLPDLLQAKVTHCSLYARLLHEALEKRNNALTLLMFTDECTPGNILAARQPKKSIMCYFTFQEFDVVHLDSMWLPLSHFRSMEAKEKAYSQAEYIRCILEYSHAECQNGFALQFEDAARLVWIDRILILGDHEGQRAVGGQKGASGYKPCWRCVNVLGAHRSVPPGYVDITATDPTAFVPQTTDGVQNIRTHLVTCRNKTELQEHEKLLGWSLKALNASVLTSPSLAGVLGFGKFVV